MENAAIFVLGDKREGTYLYTAVRKLNLKYILYFVLF